MKCVICNSEIPAGRLKALPRTKTCIQCSNTEKVGGFQIISGKNEYSELQVLSADKADEMNKLKNRRSYGPNLKVSSYAFENQKDFGPKFGSTI